MYSPVSSLSWRTACLRSIKRRADSVRRSWSGCRGCGRGSWRWASSSSYGRIPNSGCSGLSYTLSCWTVSFGIRVSVSTEPGRHSRVGALLPTVGAELEELVLLLCGLRNQISSSALLKCCVKTHRASWILGSPSCDKKSVRLKSSEEFQGRD